MSNTLLIYEGGDYTDLYLIPNDKITPHHLALLKQADGKMINGDEMNDGMQFLSNALSTKREYCYAGDPAYYCIWRRYKVTKPLTEEDQRITRVFLSGFLP